MADRVEIARRAEADLEELYLWVVERSPQQGARLVDAAAAYANERQVGKGIRRPGI